MFHFAAVSYLATELLDFRVSAHLQKHFIRIGDRQRLFNQPMLNQDAMIRRYCQQRWMGRRNALALSWVFHCPLPLESMIAPQGSAPMNLQRCYRAAGVGTVNGASTCLRKYHSTRLSLSAN